MTKCMSCVFWHCKVTEYPCNACKVIVADADRSYFAEKKEDKHD